MRRPSQHEIGDVTPALTGESACLQNASMPNILVRHVPADVHARLTARAEEAGLSLQQHVLDVLTLAASRRTSGETIARFRDLLADERSSDTSRVEAEEDDVLADARADIRAEQDARTERLLEVIDEARGGRRLGAD